MHKLNNVTPTTTPHVESGFFEAVPVYLGKDGQPTEDINMASVNYDGNPQVLEYKATTKVISSVINPPKPLSLSPADPFTRSACIEAFGLVNKNPSFPTQTMDKLEAHMYADRVSRALTNSIERATTELNKQSSISQTPSTNE